MLVFVDTGAWLAVSLRADPHHGKVADVWHRLLSEGARYVTSDLILAEAITRLRYDVGHARALQFYGFVEQAQAQGLLVVEWVGREDFESAWEIFRDFSDQEFSMVDCTSFAVCRKLGIKSALTLDSDFHTMGLELFPITS